MTVTAVTAEWNCTRCGTTNRKLVPARRTQATDRCTHCGARHTSSPMLGRCGGAHDEN